jgi:predicted Zn-dependent protease
MQQLETQVFGRSFDHYPLPIRIKKLSYAMPIVAKEIRLSKGDMVIASTRKISQRVARSNRTIDVTELSAVGASSGKILPNGATLSTGDYFQGIHRNGNGTMLRWPNLPIRVYVKQTGLESTLTNQAIKAWQSVFSVEPVETASRADVIVSWEQAEWKQNTANTLTRPVVHVDDARSIRTVILITMYPMRTAPTDQMLHAVSHQLGHAFGLWGHSDDPADVMYPALKLESNDFPARWGWRSTATDKYAQPLSRVEDYQPSQRDINTLLKVYDQPASDLKSYSPY